MQARLNIAKKTCIEIYKALNSLISSKDEQYFLDISVLEHQSYFSNKMQEIIQETYGINNKDYIYSKNIKLLDEIYYWIIKPIDDSDNYKERNRYFSTSIAICKKESILASVIINNDDGTLITAMQGGGSLFENTKLRCEDFITSENFVSNISNLDYKSVNTDYEMVYGQVSIINLVDLAKGEYDFAIFENISISDIAAGILVCKESGFVVSKFDGREFSLSGNESIIIYRPNEHKIIEQIINNNL